MLPYFTRNTVCLSGRREGAHNAIGLPPTESWNSPTGPLLQRRGAARQGTGRHGRYSLRDELHRFAGQRMVVALHRARDHGADLQEAGLEARLEPLAVVTCARRRQVGGGIRPDVRSEDASCPDERRYAPRVRFLNEHSQPMAHRTGRLTDRRVMSGIEQPVSVRRARIQSLVDEVDGGARQIVADARFTGLHPLPAPGSQKRFQRGMPEPRLKRSVPARRHFFAWDENSHRATELSGPPGFPRWKASASDQNSRPSRDKLERGSAPDRRLTPARLCGSSLHPVPEF